MSWMVVYDKLTGKQKNFIKNEVNVSGNIWIKGYAGSGKSILLVHSISDKILQNPNSSICVVVFTHSLIQMFRAGMKELRIPEKNVYLTTYHQFKRNTTHYDYIFCDEVQDLTPSILAQMTKQTKKLILAGDENQSIYLNDPATKEATANISEIATITKTTTNSQILDEIHRLTKSIQKLVAKFLPNMGILTAKLNMTKKDVSVISANSSSQMKEVEYIFSKSKENINNGNSVVVLLPSHNDIANFINIVLNINNIKPWDKESNLNRWSKPDYSKLHQYLHSTNINIEYIGNGYGNLYNAGELGKILVMTYHSAKGLDFDTVFLPFLHSGTYIYDKTLFMVGLTRSKQNLYLTYSGNDKHHFLNDIETECHRLDIDTIDSNKVSNEDELDDFDF